MANETRAERNLAWAAEAALRQERRERETRDMIAPWLQPGERVRGSVDVRLHALTPLRAPRRLRGAKPVPADGWDTSPVDRVSRIVGRVLFGPVAAVARSFSKVYYSRSFKGGWSSRAGRFLLMVRTGPSRHRYYENGDAFLVFTDRRVLVLHRRSGECLGELAPAELVVGEPKERAWRQSERVDLRFTDGSLVALDAGMTDGQKQLRALLAGRA